MKLSEDEFKVQLREKDVRILSEDILHQLNMYHGRAIHDLPAAKRGLTQMLDASKTEVKKFGEFETKIPERYDQFIYHLYKCFEAECGAFPSGGAPSTIAS